MRRILLAAAVAALLAVAGCLADGSEGSANASDRERIEPTIEASERSKPNTTSAEPGTPVEEALDPVPPEQAPADRWRLFTVAASPDGALAGFSWTVPENATGSTQGTVPIDVVPILRANVTDAPADDVAVSSWLVTVYSQASGSAFFRGGLGEMPQTVQELTPTGQDEFQRSTDLRPRSLTVQAPDVSAGDELFVVVGAKANRSVPFGLGVHASGGGPPEDVADFLTAVDAAQPVAPAPVGTGSGFDLAEYREQDSGLTSGETSWTDRIEVDHAVPEPARPTATTRVAELTFESRFDQGWSFHEGVYIAIAGAGHWALDHEVRGQALQDQGVAPSPAQFVAWSVTGDGADGPAGTSFQVTSVDANWFGFYGQFSFDFGVTLDQLIGVPGAEESRVETTPELEELAPASSLPGATVSGPWGQLGPGPPVEDRP